jgi:hypothetical protein
MERLRRLRLRGFRPTIYRARSVPIHRDLFASYDV